MRFYVKESRFQVDPRLEIGGQEISAKIKTAKKSAATSKITPSSSVRHKLGLPRQISLSSHFSSVLQQTMPR